MKKRRLQNLQKQSTSMRMKILAGACVMMVASAFFLVVFNLGDSETSKAYSEGDYRSVSSGDWEDESVWEYFDGNSWTPAEQPPGKSVQKVIITPGTRLSMYDELVLHEVEIDSGGFLDIFSNSIKVMKKNGQGGIFCSGSLQLRDVIIEGNGDFTITEGALLMIGSDAGIDKKGNSGNIQLHGKRNFDKNASYVFNGSIKQFSGNGLPNDIKNLTINNTSGVELSQSLTVFGELKLYKGILFTGKNELVLGQSVNNNATLSVSEGAVTGTFKFYYSFEDEEFFEIPLSDGFMQTNYRFYCDVSKYKKGMAEFYFKNGIPNDNSKSPYEARHVIIGISNAGYHSLNLSNGPDEAWIKLKNNAFNSEQNKNIIEWNISSRIIKTDNQRDDAFDVGEQNFCNLLTGPVPFNKFLIVRFYSNNAENAFIALTDVNGKVVKNDKIKSERGYNQVIFNVPDNFNDGVYTLQLSTTSEIQTMKVFRELKITGAS